MYDKLRLTKGLHEMQSLTNNRRMSCWLFVVVAMSFCLTACTDNATRLAFRIERVSKQLQHEQDGAEASLAYTPRGNPTEPYTVIFLPDRATGWDDLIASGASAGIAERIFEELEYVHVGRGRMLIIYRPSSPLNFTTYWSRFAYVERPLVATAMGEIQLQMKKDGNRVQVVAIR